MFKYPHNLPLLILFLFLLASSAFSQSGASNSADAIPENSSSPEIASVTEGVRFVFKNSPGNNTSIFMPVNKGKAVKIPINKGIPGDRFPFPPGKKLFFFDGDPIANNKDKPNKLGEAEIPAGMSSKVLCIIHPAASGFKFEFVDEAIFKELGTVFIRNLTTIDLAIRVFDHKNKPKQIIQIPSGKEAIFAPGRVAPGTPNASNIYPSQLCRKDEKGDWYVMRQIALEVPYFGWEILLFNWNEINNMPEVQKITIRPDRQAKLKNTNNKPAPGRAISAPPR